MNKLIILIVLLAVALSLSGCIQTTTDGRHSGQVTAIEKNGLIWKTYDVYVKTDISSSQEDRYCVEDPALIPVLINLSENRQKVTLLYNSELIVAPWRCSVDTIITGVEGIKS